MAKPYLIISGDCFIYGNKEGLKELQEAIRCALNGDVDPDDFARCTVLHAENESSRHETNYCVRRVDNLKVFAEIVREA